MIENVKIRSMKILICIIMKDLWCFFNLKSILYLELFIGNEKNVNDRIRNDDII